MEKYVVIFNALAQPARVKIFRLLVQAGAEGICPCKLAQKLKMPRNTLSFHLALLSRAGLCKARREGKNLFYRSCCSTVVKAAEFLLNDCCSLKEAREEKYV